MSQPAGEHLFTHRDLEMLGAVKRAIEGSEAEEVLSEILEIFEKIKSKVAEIVEKGRSSKISINADADYHILRLHEETTHELGILDRFLRKPKTTSTDLSLTNSKFTYKKDNVHEKGTSLKDHKVLEALKYFRDRLKQALAQATSHSAGGRH